MLNGDSEGSLDSWNDSGSDASGQGDHNGPLFQTIHQSASTTPNIVVSAFQTYHSDQKCRHCPSSTQPVEENGGENSEIVTSSQSFQHGHPRHRPVSPFHLHHRRRVASCGKKPLPGSPGSHQLRVTRDPIQPATGSLSDIRRRSSLTLEDEESDSFPTSPWSPVPRPRAFTCPETKAFNRRLKLRMLNRPPTPTPQETNGLDSGTIDLFANMQVVDTKHVERSLSSCGGGELAVISETG